MKNGVIQSPLYIKFTDFRASLVRFIVAPPKLERQIYTSEIPLIYDEWKSHAYPSDIHGLVFLIVIKNKHDC